MSFIAGFNITSTFQAIGAPAAAVLNITDHDWADFVDFLDVSSSATLGTQAGIAGLLRGDGNVKGIQDGAIPAGGAGTIVSGTSGIITFGIGTANPFRVPAMVTKVHSRGSVQGKIEWDFDVKLNVLAGAYVHAS